MKLTLHGAAKDMSGRERKDLATALKSWTGVVVTGWADERMDEKPTKAQLPAKTIISREEDE